MASESLETLPTGIQCTSYQKNKSAYFPWQRCLWHNSRTNAPLECGLTSKCLPRLHTGTALSSAQIIWEVWNASILNMDHRICLPISIPHTWYGETIQPFTLSWKPGTLTKHFMRTIPEKLRGGLPAGHWGMICAERVDTVGLLGSSIWQMFMDYWCASSSKRENAEPRSGFCLQEVHSPVREQVLFQHPPQNNAQAKSGKALGRRLRNGRLWHQSPEYGVHKVRSSPHQLLARNGFLWVNQTKEHQREDLQAV